MKQNYSAVKQNKKGKIYDSDIQDLRVTYFHNSEGFVTIFAN